MKRLVVFVICILYAHVSFCFESSDNFKATIHINTENHEKFYLNVPGPQGFKTIDSRKSFYSGEAPFLFFYPENEEINYYSKRLAIASIAGAQVSATELMEDVEKALMDSKENYKTTDRIRKRTSNYDECTLIGSYQHGKLRWLTYTQYWVGPKDSAGVMYEMAIQEHMSEKEAIETARSLIKKTVRVLQIKEV